MCSLSLSDCLHRRSDTPFAPAISAKAKKAVGQKVRAWHLNRRSGTDLSGLAAEINPQVRGWIGYYGAFYRSELYPSAWRIDQHLLRWAMQKFKRLRGKIAKANAWLDTVRRRWPRLFAHWHLLPLPEFVKVVGAIGSRKGAMIRTCGSLGLVA